MSAKISAIARCEHCRYSAIHHADTVIEVADFLRRLLIQHCEEQHPEKFKDGSTAGRLLTTVASATDSIVGVSTDPAKVTA